MFAAFFGQKKRGVRKRGCLCFLLEGVLLFEVESLLETVYATAGVNQLLLAGVVRMAGGANFNADVLLRRAGVDHVTADASDGCAFINGMNSVLHRRHSFPCVPKGHRISLCFIITHKFSNCKGFLKKNQISYF